MDYLVLIRRYAPFDSFGFGFEGDDRKCGSNSPYVTSRTVGIILFNMNGKVYTYGNSSGSKFYGFGTWISEKIGTHYSKVNSKISSIIQGNNSLSFTVHTEGANPLVPVFAPDIDTYLDLTFKINKKTIDIRGQVRGDTFPNAEILIVDGGHECKYDNASLLLFDYRTSGGKNSGPFTRLWGSNKINHLGEFEHSIPHINGKFIACSMPTVITGQ